MHCANNNDRSRNVLKPSRMCLILFFMISWFIFPVLFLMGPETSGMISYHTAALLHAIADIVCKSLFSLAAWHFRSVRLRELEEKQAKEAADGTDSDEENQKGGFQRGGFNRLESPSMSRLYSVAPGKLETEMAPRSFTQAFPSYSSQGQGGQGQNGRSPDNVQQLVQRMHELEHRLAAAQQGGSIGSVSADISPSPSSSNLVGMASQQQSQQHVLASQSASKMQYPWEVGSDGGRVDVLPPPAFYYYLFFCIANAIECSLFAFASHPCSCWCGRQAAAGGRLRGEHAAADLVAPAVADVRRPGHAVAGGPQPPRGARVAPVADVKAAAGPQQRVEPDYAVLNRGVPTFVRAVPGQ